MRSEWLQLSALSLFGYHIYLSLLLYKIITQITDHLSIAFKFYSSVI